MTKENKKYDANFTAGGILHHEFKSLMEILLSDNFEELIKIETEQNNLIGVATKTARQRIIQEIRRRNENAPAGFWISFIGWTEIEQKFALFYLILKTYPLILDIHFEVAVKKHRTGNSLDSFDIQMRMDEIASHHEEVSSWTTATLKKLNVQYRKALKDIGLYTGKKLQRPQRISTEFYNYFENLNEHWFLEACFMDSI